MGTSATIKVNFSKNLKVYDKDLKREFNILAKKILENVKKIDKKPSIEVKVEYF